MMAMFPRCNLKKHATLLSIIAKTIDLSVYLAAALLAFFQQFHNFEFSVFYEMALLVSALLMIPVFSFFSVYESLRGRSWYGHFTTFVPAFGALMIILAAIAFITKTGEHFSRFWFLLWHLYAFILLILFRFGLRQILKKMREKGFNHKRIIIVGWNALSLELVQRIHDALSVGFDVVAVFKEGETNLDTNILKGAEILTLSSDLADFIETKNIDEVWVTSSVEQTRLQEIVAALQNHVLQIRYFPTILGMKLLNHSVTEMLGLPVIDIISSPMVEMNRIVKAIEDKLLSGLILVGISPIFLFICLLVKLSSKGPVFYRQKRNGWDGRPIDVYKFRTMYVHNEPAGMITQACASDPRVTKLGKLLRKTSLDELPQFINVLQGGMSIVGPRPHAIEHNIHYKNLISSYMQRHQMKPGITGWAQVNGWRGETDALEKMEKRVEYDLYYIDNWSLWFDLKIIFLTIWKGFVHRNAY